MNNKKVKQYILPFRRLSEGEHEFEYQLNDGFFEAYDSLLECTGNIVVKVLFLKQDSKQKLSISMRGNLNTTCDRCLELMEIPFEAETYYYLREAEEGEEEKEDLVFVSQENQDLDLWDIFYELVMLNMPQSKMHEEGECDEQMLSKLEALRVKEDKIDPRWAELEKLIKKDK